MFRYKEAFLDINQFIRDLFVILSSLNASHNNVVFPCLLSGSCGCMDFTRRMCDLNMIYDARMRGESIYFYLNICKWIMQILCWEKLSFRFKFKLCVDKSQIINSKQIWNIHIWMETLSIGTYKHASMVKAMLSMLLM